MRKLFFVCAILFFTTASPPAARSAPVHEFNEAVAAAYGFYREAFFLLRAGNAQVASLELEEMAEHWGVIVKRFADSPPDIFSTDSAWKKTLAEINERIAQGLEAAIAGNAKAASKALEPIRKMLSDLRRRNGAVIFSDYVDRANAAFAKLYEFRKNPPDFDAVEQVDQLRQITAVTAYWYEQVRENAPKATAHDPEFKRLMDDSLHSLSRIWVAIASKKEANLISILRGLHSSDRILFFRFG
ncbi:MAG: hypothetical protein HQ494_01875 [Rhodospirillales bacterium]|nr:hypothetical protein [Rhodospirillales bacterium]